MALNIDGYLGNDETIVASYQQKKKRYYATDRRLIYTRKKHLEDASYNHITRIIMDKVSHKILIILGIFLIIIGALIMTMSFSDGVVVFIIGVIFVVLFFVLRGSEYSIKLSSGDKIPIPVTKSSNVEAFIKAIRDKIR